MKSQISFTKAIIGGVSATIIMTLFTVIGGIMNGMSFSSGLFSGSIIMALASLVGHLVYGAVLGLIYKPSPKLVVA